ncbi:hypothetical protein NDU88_004463 [Pleurodeles waltl]|uniref:Uncharacterized protein n=1 Tax=Pleurodeles waltl TaxID=8319 RepID=A0AAV7PL20_PLEWA|nr:hypothetical protein NDU88_004463 [Pleurodeles waltl]
MVKPKPPKPQLMADAKGLNPAGLAGAQADALQQMNQTLQAHSAQFDKLLQAVLDTKTTLEAKIDSVVIEVNLLRADHRKLVDRAEIELREAEKGMAMGAVALEDLQVLRARTNEIDMRLRSYDYRHL